MGILDNPMALLTMRANPAAMGLPANAPAPAPRPEPQAAAPAAPPASSAPGQGGGGLSFGNLGTRLSMAMSGERGLFAGAPNATADAVVDPTTGVPAGAMRKINNQSIMKMGLMLMAAGARQSDDSRARILASVGDAADTSGAINSFAANRLEMAKLKLLEKTQAQETASANAMNAFMGIPSANPGPNDFPPAPAPAVGSTEQAAAVAAGKSPVAPPAAPPVSANAAERERDMSLSTPPALPAGAKVLDQALLPTEPPAPPVVGKWTPNDNDRAAFAMIPDNKGRQEFISKRMEDYAKQEMTTEPYFKPGVGVVADVYKNGRKTETKKLGDATQTVVAVKDPVSGATTYETRNSVTGALEDVKVVRDEVEDSRRKTQFNPNSRDQVVDFDKDGNAIGMKNLPGGKADLEAKELARTEAEKSKNAQNKADIVLTDIGRMRELLSGETTTNPVSGLTGAAAGKIPGTKAGDYAYIARSVISNIAFDRLGQMRAESPTGGALGSVTEGELELLRATMGDIALGGSAEVMKFNLDRLERQYSEIMAKAAAYPNAAKYGFGKDGEKPAGDTPAPAGGAPAATSQNPFAKITTLDALEGTLSEKYGGDMSKMGDEEFRAFQKRFNELSGG